MKSYHWFIILLACGLVAVSVKLALVMSETDPKNESAPDSTALECIMTRASVRDYIAKAVPDSIVEKVLRAGMAAPTAANCQPWQFILIDDQALKDSISESFQYAKMVSRSAFDVVVCGNENLWMDSDTKSSGFWIQDCSAACENMLLAAHALGLGGVWCGVYPDAERMEKLSQILELPDHMVPLAILSFGYPSGKVVPKQKWDASKVRRNLGN